MKTKEQRVAYLVKNFLLGNWEVCV